MTEAEPNDPLEEMARENEISLKLVERLAEAGQSLQSDRPESPGRIAEGLLLLKQYRSLHVRRFRDHLEPEARVVAMPGCFEHLDLLDRQSLETDTRWGRVADALDAYARAEGGAVDRLSSELGTFTQDEYDRIRFEGDYPLSCLPSALPDDASGRVSAKFTESNGEVTDLERHIGRYLEESPGAERTNTPESKSLPVLDAPDRKCACCDPIPEDLA